ncbi:MAG: hypothetical protein IPH05_14030 [Flavobacteriales bacterium]|jgi:hypothetical protein|nr:hypothetical protein [Flavobacteriales bacterium]MBK6884030.1 hypothetical protein [Flavobacteriales bacterium]MBK7111115.1 hypothetical protein [Flavobacteriales bacterium]MBK7617966.1 hypothetical protein [Flavobacteriales bacterium]MBK8533583.1 hypothetical protein [Flavobacteriales bacterium]
MAFTSYLMIHCRKATELGERRELEPLTFVEQAGLWFHTRMCKYCKAYLAQSEVIDEHLQERLGPPVDTEALEARILSGIER